MRGLTDIERKFLLLSLPGSHDIDVDHLPPIETELISRGLLRSWHDDEYDYFEITSLGILALKHCTSV